MEIIYLINRIIKDCMINIFTYLVFIKVINYKENNYKKMIIIIITSIIQAILGVGVAEGSNILFGILVCYIIESLIISKIIKIKLRYSIIVTFISLSITYSMYLISLLVASAILKIIIPDMKLDNIAILFFTGILEIILINRFFHIKRFQNGISFLQNYDKTNKLGIIGFCMCGIVLVIFSVANFSISRTSAWYLMSGTMILAICLTIWIRRKITKHYKQDLKKNTIEQLENEIKAKDEEIDKILEENKAIATINHKYSSRIKSLEKISAKILTKPELVEAMKAEFGTEFGELEEQIKKISEEYSAEISEKVKHENKLEKTGIFGIDNILEYMKEEAEKNNIKFDFKITGSINYMIEKIINQSRLETLLGDHIKDAIIAIQHSNNTYKSILTTIGIVDDCYEISIYDTGIEFEIDTLLKLGTEATTTHKETGGSGIGFMTTFDTLNYTSASLIIDEKHKMNNTDYTKAVTIKFDGKNEYKIKSYRAEEIRRQMKNNRIIIENQK